MNELTAYKLGTLLWKYPVKWMEAREWLGENFTKEEAYFSPQYINYIHSKGYTTHILFRHETDFLVFKIKFPELFIDRLAPYVEIAADSILSIL
jgi:hypothetical protein